MTTLDQGMQHVKAAWNYADVIALVTANLDGHRFNGDRGAWLRGIAELAADHPAFFGRVHFVRRDPLPPYSKEVDEVLKILGKWEYQGSFNPRFSELRLGEEAKRELKNLLEPKFNEDELKTIEDMSKSLAKHVTLEEEGTTNVRDSRTPPSRD